MKKVVVFLSVAVVLGTVSITPWAARWSLMSLGPAADPDHMLTGVIQAWQTVVDVLQQGQVISASRAFEWHTHGIRVDDACRSVALVAVVLAWIAALGVYGQTAKGRTPPAEVREAAMGVSQAQHALTNVLLDPQAQPLAEPLSDVARQLARASDSLSSIHDDRS